MTPRCVDVVRGDTIEIFPAHLEDRAWRISLFGDEIETITEFDPLTGKKTGDLQSVIAMKLEHGRPDILIRPAVSRFRVLDFMKIDAILAETEAIRDELKRAIDAAVSDHEKARV